MSWLDISGTDNHVHSTQGDILYSNGGVKLRNNTFIVKTAEEHVTILRHSGEHWSMEVESLWFQCPVGHRLMIINTTSHRIEEVDINMELIAYLLKFIEGTKQMEHCTGLLPSTPFPHY